MNTVIDRIFLGILPFISSVIINQFETISLNCTEVIRLWLITQLDGHFNSNHHDHRIT